MNKLMMFGASFVRYFDEVSTDGGGAAADTGSASDANASAADANASAADANASAAGANANAASVNANADGANANAASVNASAATDNGEVKPALESQSDTGAANQTQANVEVSDEDFLKSIVVDDETKNAANGGPVEIDPEIAKGMLPAFREANLNPEQASKLANAFVRQQIEQAKRYSQLQNDAMREGNERVLKMFPDRHDWDLMKAARDHFFKPAGKDGNGGVMLNTIAHSQLGNDPEFLALLKFAGEKLATDSTPTGSGAGSGRKTVSIVEALGLK